MAPVDASEEFADFFSCGICSDFFHDPVTVPCCGNSFCRGCLRQWIKKSVHTSGIPRCPAGCNKKLSYQLPGPSLALKAAMEKLVPEEVERRRLEEEEDASLHEEVCHGGFKPWQTVAAARDIGFGNMIGVRQGMPGIIVGNFTDGSHVTVKFDSREDGSELCVNVLPDTLMNPLPGGFRLGEKVVALFDLMLDGSSSIKLGTSGVVVGMGDVSLENVHVVFDETSGGTEGYVSVHIGMISADKLLVGGFNLGQKIQASMDLVVGTGVAVPFGTPGTIIGEYSDTRLTVAFMVDCQGTQTLCHFNVLPMEIRTFCDAPCNLPPGQVVRARHDLVSMNCAIVKAGTRGVIVACMDDTRIIVSFDGCEETDTKQCLTVAENCIEKTNLEGEMMNIC